MQSTLIHVINNSSSIRERSLMFVLRRLEGDTSRCPSRMSVGSGLQGMMIETDAVPSPRSIVISSATDPHEKERVLRGGERSTKQRRQLEELTPSLDHAMSGTECEEEFTRSPSWVFVEQEETCRVRVEFPQCSGRRILVPRVASRSLSATIVLRTSRVRTFPKRDWIAELLVRKILSRPKRKDENDKVTTTGVERVPTTTSTPRTSSISVKWTVRFADSWEALQIR